MKRALRKPVCVAGCIAALIVGTAGHTDYLQAASGQTNVVRDAEENLDSQYGKFRPIEKISLKSKKSSASGWSDDKKYYYDKNGEMVTGIAVIEGKFYCFKSDGKYDKSKTKKIQKAATYEKPFSKLKKYIGKPNKSKYLASCYGKGKDGILTYDNFEVYTFRPDKGKEIFMGAE